LLVGVQAQTRIVFHYSGPIGSDWRPFRGAAESRERAIRGACDSKVFGSILHLTHGDFGFRVRPARAPE
jgi:hypothetical protein